MPEQDRVALLEAIERTTEEEVRLESHLAESLRVLCSRIEDARREFPEYPNVRFVGEMEDLDQNWGTAEVDIEASMERVMNDVNAGKVHLMTADEWLSEQKKQKQVEPGGTDNAGAAPRRV
ncbi:MAG: hypothetical protein IPL39_01080 [Opitutaceae bacterium]|nr:hypothetical protein [Opitutaceae bacterium]